MFYLYILFSSDFDKYYVGISSSPYRRLYSHNHQQESNTFTKKYRPWKMVALFEAGIKRSEALKVERFIKNQKSRKLIEKLVDPEFILEDKLAHLVRVPHVRD